MEEMMEMEEMEEMVEMVEMENVMLWIKIHHVALLGNPKVYVHIKPIRIGWKKIARKLAHVVRINLFFQINIAIKYSRAIKILAKN